MMPMQVSTLWDEVTVITLLLMIALTERYDTDGSKPVGKYLNTAA